MEPAIFKGRVRFQSFVRIAIVLLPSVKPNYKTESNKRLDIEIFAPTELDDLSGFIHAKADVRIVCLPRNANLGEAKWTSVFNQLNRRENSLVVIVGESQDLVQAHFLLKEFLFQNWIVIKTQNLLHNSKRTKLPQQHIDA